MPRYLYIQDNMRPPVFSEDEPADFDLDLARTGVLVIIRTADWHSFGGSGEWEPTARAVLAPLEFDEDGQELPPRHVAAGDLVVQPRRGAI